jgi:hypothetical protein
MLQAVLNLLAPGPEGRTLSGLASLAQPLRRRSRSEPVASTAARFEAVKNADLFSFDGRRLSLPARDIRKAAGMARMG